jgi:subtilisin family serine protease
LARSAEQFWPLAVFALAVALVLIAAGGGKAERLEAGSPVTWQGLAGGARPRVSLGQRMIVLLRYPSLADRVAASGGLASGEQERRWTAATLASQRLLLSKLAVHGVRVTPEFSYGRVVNGFSAVVSPPAVALLERQDEVAGVFPVRAAYPAVAGPRRPLLPSSTRRLDVGLPGFDGRGVTIALLDSGVDRAHPFLRGRVRDGIDIVGGSELGIAAPRPDDRSELEQHGTQLAGILVGAGGPSGLAGIAAGAWVLPIRVAGWQRDAAGGYAVYARSDQVLAGLERAVDPNGDGDAHDAARIALVGLAEPFAAFADGPEAKAAAGALRLDTLVVAPAGNDGGAGTRRFGSISGPGGAPAVLTVGAADLRTRSDEVRVVLRAGLRVLLDVLAPLGGAIAPEHELEAQIAAPELAGKRRMSAASGSIRGYFDRRGFSLVAGRGALVPAGDSPQRTVEAAARAGAVAALLYGGSLPGGALGLDASAPIPVVGLPAPAARRILRAIRAGATATVSIGKARSTRNRGARRVAAFSSGGLSFDSRVKPELVAPGVGIATAEAGANSDGSPRYGTVNGSSVAAAVAAGAAALLAQARPGLDAPALKAILVGSASPLVRDSLALQGGGLLDLGAASATEVAVTPSTLALGQATKVAWQSVRDLHVRNESIRPLRIAIDVERHAEGAAVVSFSASPSSFLLRPGKTRRIDLEAVVKSEPSGHAPAEGFVVIRPDGAAPVRIPWSIPFGRRRTNLLAGVALQTRAFRVSDNQPSLLTLRVGRVVRSRTGDQIQPAARLDVELWTAAGERLGVLARLRDLLPGSYALGITGRDPEGDSLPPGAYRLRLLAYPTTPGPPSAKNVPFRIKGPP